MALSGRIRLDRVFTMPIPILLTLVACVTTQPKDAGSSSTTQPKGVEPGRDYQTFLAACDKEIKSLDANEDLQPATMRAFQTAWKDIKPQCEVRSGLNEPTTTPDYTREPEIVEEEAEDGGPARDNAPKWFKMLSALPDEQKRELANVLSRRVYKRILAGGSQSLDVCKLTAIQQQLPYRTWHPKTLDLCLGYRMGVESLIARGADQLREDAIALKYRPASKPAPWFNAAGKLLDDDKVEAACRSKRCDMERKDAQQVVAEAYEQRRLLKKWLKSKAGVICEASGNDSTATRSSGSCRPSAEGRCLDGFQLTEGDRPSQKGCKVHHVEDEG